MNRPIRRSKIDTPTARSNLPFAKKPVWKSLEQGVFIGYRRGKTERRWVGRVYNKAEQKYVVEAVGYADDADVVPEQSPMTYAQARDAVLALAAGKRAKAASSSNNVATVRTTVEAYIAMRDAREAARHGREVKSHAHRLKNHVLSDDDLAETPLEELTDARLAKWRKGLGGAVGNRRRIANDFRAALLAAKPGEQVRLAIREGLAIPSAEVEEAEPEARENQILTDDEVRRLLAAGRSADDGGDLYRVMLLLAATGARFSQIRRLRVMDVQSKQSRIMVPGSFKGRKRTSAKPHYPVPVGQDVIAALVPVIEGRKGTDLLLERWRHRQAGHDRQTRRAIWERVSRGGWATASELTRPFAVVAKAADLEHVIPYAFRHSSIVRGIRVGLPIRLVAAAHDTSVAMIERHYARWIVEGLEELTRKAIVPMIGQASDCNVVSLHNGAA